MVSYEIHHVFPREFGGPDVAANKVRICPNAHSDIHYAMDRLLVGKPVNRREFGVKVWRLMMRGLEQVRANPKAHAIAVATAAKRV
jgi:hypothetical protein